ncbi:MBL fold metallo-hydrolase [Streptomyces sp. WAC06614]|uniref:MBL fold metallo-hydrolase n=1 Tax=Streptomyces sp. WAC06614 TaxID=2487416 RepID=UPI000F7B4383|nr:MBL fold metallo-hydrolase [Streptomyces sp. WAC06614]RSS79290.1 MBL fold metallo-hydrolase [Streptomyces sp. WAC06614]
MGARTRTGLIDFGAAAPRPRALDVRWIHGSPSAKHDTDPEIQVHAYDEHTVILRQNMAVDYEAPFLFLLFGNDRAVLIDTGATASAEFFPLRQVVDGLVDDWLARNPRPAYHLLVLHTHPHGDHVAGDGQFADRPDTTVIGAELATAWAYFGFGAAPDAVARVDLGGRVLECLATPGHHEAAVTYYDPWTGFLLTGDTVYPGRLYIQDWQAFTRTIERLIDFCDGRSVTHVLGCHIEMTRQPGVDYPIRTVHQPDEPPLEMTTAHLREIRTALADIGPRPERRAYPLFILCPDI